MAAAHCAGLFNGQFLGANASLLVPHGDEIDALGEAGEVEGEAVAAVALHGDDLLSEDIADLDTEDVLGGDGDLAMGGVGREGEIRNSECGIRG